MSNVKEEKKCRDCFAAHEKGCTSLLVIVRMPLVDRPFLVQVERRKCLFAQPVAWKLA